MWQMCTSLCGGLLAVVNEDTRGDEAALRAEVLRLREELAQLRRVRRLLTQAH